MKKKLISLAVASLVLGALILPATSAHAATAGAAAGTCQVTLPTWPTPAGGGPTCGNGSLQGPAGPSVPVPGVAIGAFLPGGPICLPTCTFSASVVNYAEGCQAGEPPLTGTADGTLFLNGTPVATYEWTRVGLTAVIVVHPIPASTVSAGAGVAAFLPLPPLPTCANPGSLTAQVVGAVFGASAP